MSEQRCETCKHWQQSLYQPDAGNLMAYYRSTPLPIGHCLALRLVGDALTAVTEDVMVNSQPLPRTRPDFGCILHEPR